MNAKILTVINQKGGVGKTLMAMSVAGALARRGHKVLVADADTQGTASHWAARSPESSPFPAAVVSVAAHGPKVHTQLRNFVDAYDYIIVDCPPNLEAPQPKSALLVSDLVLLPAIPSAESTWAAANALQLIEDVRTINEGLRVAIVITQAQACTVMTRDFGDVLADFNVKILATRMHLRQAYRQAVVLGTTVHALGAAAQPAIDELERLVDEVLAMCAAEVQP